VGCAFLVLKKREKLATPASKAQLTDESQTKNDLHLPLSTPVTPAPKVTPNQPVQEVNPTTNDPTQHRLESLSNIVQNWSALVHDQIQFYGKVVDESNQPIEGAGVRFVWAQMWPLPEGTPSTNVISDQEGLFSITGVVGSRLGVHVSKGGYYYVKSLNSDSFNYSSLPGMTPFRPDPKNPILFHLRKKGPGADLISATLMKVKIPLDGMPVNIDFFNRNSGGSGQLRLSQIKPSYEGWKQATVWSFKMEIPYGGFVEQNDEFPIEAPETGYQPVIEFDFKAGQPDWNTHFTKNYYIVFGNPPCYGRLTIETDISWNSAHITYTVNPDGSRNLESDPNNAIQPGQ